MRIGSSLGRYRLISKIGEGGMGQVFQAEDDRLHRHVAIKILPPELQNDRERLARMEREAHALAQLEHPNIAGIYGLEEAAPEGESRPIPFLVMQYAEGDTLAARLAHGPIPVDEALPIGLQIARALEAAHEKGIVHRDLKPANIVLAADGRVKLLDFGLAKAFSGDGASLPPDLSASPTVTGGTRAGMILGTAGYMSPEQARGKSVDRRTDVWAFGCVMYEMLTGHTTFPGETVTDVLGAIVHRDPEWTAMPGNTPPGIRALIEHCLRKDITRRMQSMGDVRIALEEYNDQPFGELPRVVAPAPSRWRWLPWAVAAAAVAVAVAVVMLRPAATTAGPVSRFSVEIGDATLSDTVSSVAVSNDGGRIAIVQSTPSGRTLTVRPIDQLKGATVTSPAPPYNPFFSPDGHWVGFVTTTALLKAPAAGGTALTLAAVNRARGATWTDSDEIIIAAGPAQGLSRLPAAGGSLTPLTTLDEKRGEVSHRWPYYVTGHDVVLFTSHTAVAGQFDNASIDAINLTTNVRKTVYRGGSFGRYVPTGHLLFVNKNVVYAVAFDIRTLEVTGTPSPVAQDVSYSAAEGFAQFAVSQTGLAVYRTGRGGEATYDVLWVDSRGQSAPLWPGARTYAEPRISPDGTKVAFMVLADGDWDLWVYDRIRQVATRLTFTPGLDGPGVWSPDSQYIAYSSGPTGLANIFRRRADGSGDAEPITEAKASQYVSSWSGDGKFLVYHEAVNASDIFIVRVDGDRKPRQFLSTSFNEDEAAISPDGRFVAYQSDESGRREVYVRPIDGAGKWQISEGGGGYPRWPGDGRQLFYRDNEGVVSVPVTSAGNSLQAGRARRALKGSFRGGAGGMSTGSLTVADYDVSSDGKQFVMFPPLDPTTAGRAQHLTFVLNWFTELERLVPATK